MCGKSGRVLLSVWLAYCVHFNLNVRVSSFAKLGRAGLLCSGLSVSWGEARRTTRTGWWPLFALLNNFQTSSWKRLWRGAGSALLIVYWPFIFFPNECFLVPSCVSPLANLAWLDRYLVFPAGPAYPPLRQMFLLEGLKVHATLEIFSPACALLSFPCTYCCKLSEYSFSFKVQFFF